MKIFGNQLGSRGFSHLLLPIGVVVVVGAIGAALLVKSHAATGYCVYGDYSEGSSGHCVRDIQIMSNEAFKMDYVPNYGRGMAHLTVDGDFGPATKSDVRAFQADMGRAKDGIVGPSTWQALCGVGWSYPGSGGARNSAYKDAGCSARGW